MKKFKAIIFMLVVMIVSAALKVSNVYAIADMKITKKTYITTGINDRKEAKFNTNKGYAYCITLERVGPKEDTTLRYNSRTDSGGLLYILSKASDDDSSYLTTQLAIWKYKNDALPDAYKDSNKTYVKKALDLAAEAKNNEGYTTTPKIVFDGASTEIKQNVDNNKYMTSQMITIKSSNINGKVTLKLEDAPRGAEILSSNNVAKTEVENGDKIYIRIPVNNVTKQTDFKLIATAKGKRSFVELYSVGVSKYQDLIVLTQETHTVTVKAPLSVIPIKRKCTSFEGTFYDDEGNEVSKEIYQTKCVTLHLCEKVDDKYYGRMGTVVTYEEYKTQCEETKCKKVDDKYYGSDGSEVSYENYRIQCENPKCEKIGDKYFGKNGTEVTQDKYKVECGTAKCEKIGDKYYGSTGTEVTYNEYRVQCESPKCEKIGDKYYGKDGLQVTYEQYSAQCERHYCEFINNTYFDKSGYIVSKDEYERQCVHKCEIYDNHYYDNQGNITTEEKYKTECLGQVVPVPDTANTSPLYLVLVILGAGLLGGTYSALYNYKKLGYKK